MAKLVGFFKVLASRFSECFFAKPPARIRNQMADSASADAKPQSQLVRTQACDWVLEHLFHSSTQPDGTVFSMAFECLAETFAIMDMAGEGSQLDLVDLVVQQYRASNRTAQGSYTSFTNYVNWLRNGKPEATQALLCYEAYTHLHLVLKYGPLLGNLLTFKCLLKAKVDLGKLKDEVARTWGLAFADYLHARTVKKAGQERENHNKEFVLAADKLLIRALKLMTNKNICGPKLAPLKAEGFSRTVCFPKYFIACVLALQDADEQCLYWLTKAKFQNELPEISAIESNTDFDVIKARQADFNVILKEPTAYTKERFAYYRDRRRYVKTQYVVEAAVPALNKLSASVLLSESSLLRDALSQSTLDILTRNGKFDLMINLKQFLEPVKSKESMAAETRLKERMALYGVEARREIPGDGNCQMYSISHQLTGNINHGAFIRRTLVRWLRTHATNILPNGATLTDFVCDRKYEDYCASMAANGTWGDHLTLIAATEVFCCRVVIISSAPGDNYIIEINPALGEKAVTLSNSSIMAVPETNLMMLSHLAEFHYGSVHPVDMKDCAFN